MSKLHNSALDQLADRTGIRVEFYDPAGTRYGFPTFPWLGAPDGLATLRQLRADGLRPGGQDPVAQILWRHRAQRRVAYLYHRALAKPKRTATPAQRAAISKGCGPPHLPYLRAGQALLHPPPLRRMPRLPRRPITMNIFDDCRYCIDGNLPAGTHQVLGPVYQPCPHCLNVCSFCEGEGLFPADYTCLDCFHTRMATLGLAPVLCARCFGVVDLIPTDTTPEVTPHAHQ